MIDWCRRAHSCAASGSRIAVAALALAFAATLPTGAAHAAKFTGATEKNSYNLFSQNPWYVGKLASGAKLPPLRRLIDNQQEFIAAFEEIIRRPNEQEEVLREMAVRCLAA